MSQSQLRPGEACLAGTCFVRQPVSQAGPAHLRQPGRASGEDHELHIRLRPQRGHHLLRHGRTSRLPSSPVSQAGGGAECHHLPLAAYSPLAGRPAPQHHWATEGRPARAAGHSHPREPPGGRCCLAFGWSLRQVRRREQEGAVLLHLGQMMPPPSSWLVALNSRSHPSVLFTEGLCRSPWTPCLCPRGRGVPMVPWLGFQSS